MRHLPIACALVVSLSVAVRAAEQQLYRSDHVAVSYTGVDESQAQAIATVVEAARKAAIADFGFDMPDSIAVSVDCRPGNPVRLFNDGQDRFNLGLRSKADLAPPGSKRDLPCLRAVSRGGASRDVSRDPPARFPHRGRRGRLGALHRSRLVDSVYATQGEKAWSDPYDYRADGTRRLEARMKEAKRDPVTDGAALWQQLAKDVGDKQLPQILKAWGKASIDPEDPGRALRTALLEAANTPSVAAWWNKAEPVFVLKREKSGFSAQTIAPADLANQPKELALDDGKPGNKASFAGGGHAVAFDAPGEDWCLTSVRIYGARYGMPQAPDEDFRAWLCDEKGKSIREFKFPYRLFLRGNPSWIKLQTPPTRVPRRFILCVGFNPTATKGVFVFYDASADGDSREGLPGQEMGKFGRGDWLIRATVDQPKSANSLNRK